MTENGYLTVQTTTSRSAYPVEGALVTVSQLDEEGQATLIATGTTDNSGLSPRFTLSAPPRSSSLKPDGGVPYSTYLVSVTHPEYAPVSITGVDIFSGIAATLPVAMRPKEAPGEFPSPPLIVVIPPEELAKS